MNTIGRSLNINGIGLHEGNNISVSLYPTDKIGILFLHNNKYYDARHAKITVGYATRLAWNDYSISMTEHLMCALWCCNISSIIIDVNGTELPILDGSVKPWIELLNKFKKSSIETDIPYILNKDIFIEGKNGATAYAYPSSEFSLHIKTDFNNVGIGKKETALDCHDIRDKITELSSARTFTELSQIDILRKNNLALGGSLNNSLVFDSFGNILNPEGLRMKDEPHFHKILDAIGDLFLLSSNIKASITLYKPGHEINSSLVKSIRNISIPKNELRIASL